MRLDPIGPPVNPWAARFDARWALLLTIGYVVVVVSTPIDRGRWLAAEALALSFMVGLVGADPARLARRWLAFLVLVSFLAFMIAQSHPLRGPLGLLPVFGAILLKNSLAFTALMTLADVMPFPKLLGGLARLGVPRILVATLHFMYRYVHVLADELERMVHARRARTFRRSGRLEWARLGGLIGMLFVRSFERGERVHAAMRARGWDGTLRTLGPE